ncbi:MAG: VanZ family protein [Planctomycetes bacterium]|nr:VanZ family protein [Planctomycetota bacterium]
MAVSRRQKVTIILLVFYWLNFFILAHIPVPGIVSKAGVSDKGMHFLAYLILVFLLWFAISPDQKVGWRKAVVWWVFIVLTGYGAADELLQGFTGRNCDVMDMVANLTGILAGLILFSVFSFWPAALLVTGAVIFGITNITRANLAELVPVTNAIFHLFAYPIFSMLWICYMHLYLSLKPPKPKWLMAALAVPIGLLLTVKLFSVILGKGFGLREVIISVVGIAAVITIIYLITLFHKTQDNRTENIK